MHIVSLSMTLLLIPVSMFSCLTASNCNREDKKAQKEWQESVIAERIQDLPTPSRTDFCTLIDLFTAKKNFTLAAEAFAEQLTKENVQPAQVEK